MAAQSKSKSQTSPQPRAADVKPSHRQIELIKVSRLFDPAYPSTEAVDTLLDYLLSLTNEQGAMLFSGDDIKEFLSGRDAYLPRVDAALARRQRVLNSSYLAQ